MKYLFIIINTFLSAFTLFFCVKIIYKNIDAKVALSHDYSVECNTTDNKIKKSKNNFFPKNHYDKIIKRNLFKVDTQKTKLNKNNKILKKDTSNLRKTDLNLKLIGTVTGAGAKTRAFAVIEDKSTHKQLLFHEKDNVYNVAILKIILRKKVILFYNNEEWVLEMDSKDNNNLFSKTKPNSSEKIILKRSFVNNAIGNMNNLVKQIKIKPYFSRGKPSGFLVSRIKRNSLFQKMGLKNGDVIIKIDGKEINSIDDALEIYHKINAISDINIELQRQGKTKEINYHVQ
ncbi:MAG: hypothetical protein B6I26_05910 [Desulfobacteraceae bacterium 4572_130]|nr:MAG: hypothetical protein B6I26_05910 [Desulfobacteraceae bacterium 4572_130]